MIRRTGDFRKIGDANHNRFLAVGVGRHRPTQIVPHSLLGRFSDETTRNFTSKHVEVQQLLDRALGAPFYSEDGFILYCGDSNHYLEKLQAMGPLFDLTITSPPYNIGKEYEVPMTLDRYVEWCSGWMSQIFSVTKPAGAFWLNVGFFEVEGKGLCVPIPYLIWDKSPFYLLQEIVWTYGAGVSTKKRLSPRNEKWLFFIKNSRSWTFNLDEIRDPNVKYPDQRKNDQFRCNPLGKNPSDVWEFPKVTTGLKRSSRERTGHPAQFPLQVAERIVRASSNPLDIILDPFAGSCSAGIAAVGTGRIFIGFEILPRYCEMAVERHKAFLKQRLISRRRPEKGDAAHGRRMRTKRR